MSTSKPRKLSAFHTALLFLGLYFPLPEGTFNRKPLSSTKQQSGLSGAYKLVAGVVFVSQAGNWFQYTAFPVMVLNVAPHPAQWISTYWSIIALVGIPAPFLGGFLADRFSVWVLVLVTQTITVVASWTVWHMVAIGSTHLWMQSGLLALVYTSSTIGLPGLVKLLLALVSREAEERAIAVNGLLQASAKVIGPAIAGLLLLWVKPAWLFLADSVSYLPLLVVLMMLPWVTVDTRFRQAKAKPVPGEHQQEPSAAGKTRWFDGISYVWEKPTLRLALFVFVIMITFTFNGHILNPLIVFEVSHWSGSYGLLLSAQGIGQMLALAVVARSAKKDDESDEKPWLLRPELNQMLLWAGALCVSLVGFGFSRWLPIDIIMMALVGGVAGPYVNAVNTQIQTTPGWIRGRVVGLLFGLTGAGNFIGMSLTSWLLLADLAASTVNNIEAGVALVVVVIVAIRQRRRLTGK